MTQNEKNTSGTAPKFLGIGSQRAGTTWLYECLKEHPEVFLPEKKELHFFDLNYDKNTKAYFNNFPQDKIQNASTWGEITPNYYQAAEALERIANDVPNAKLIYIVREPISRLYSQYQLYSQSHFKNLSIEETLVKYSNVIDLSMQGKHLQRLYQLFNKEQILVLFYDELCSNPKNFFAKVCRFLDIDDQFSPSRIDHRINRVVFPKVQQLMHQLHLSWLIKLIKKSPVAEKIKRSATKSAYNNLKNPSIAQLKTLYQPDIALLEELLQVDLNHWK